ncbi:MAG: prealbumin-like fold domain-containing protein, partial [Peptostreptococcus anaerobius]
YVIKETKAPVGYKKITAEWKIEIKDDGGRMYAEYQGPEDTPSSLIDDNKKAGAGSSASNELIKYKARLTYIDPEANTYIQRIYIDTRGYYGNSDENTKGLLNLQITPKYKREEIDTPGQSPKTIKDGVKTAYYQSFKLADTTSYTNMDDPAIDKILRTYDLANKDLSLDKTARWRPFDWGFDEDQLNLGKGVYIVEVEGFYDDVIINNKSDKTDKYDIPDGDLGKIDLNLNFYAGAREFQQLYEKPDGTFGYKYIEKGSYQGGAEALRAWIEKTQGKDIADAWAKQTTDGEKYQNFIGKHVKIGNKDYYTGRIYPSLDKPIFERKISANLDPLYNSKTQQEIPREGLEVENEQETYNITFSKHGRDNSTEGINSEKVTKNRLEGAIFQLQIRGPGGIYEDMPGKTVASAFNGYFGFRGLKPGRYRLIEVKAPEGYVPIKGPVLHFTIAYKKGEIDKETGDITPGRGVVTLEYNEGNGIFQYAPDDPKITPEDGKLTDYVTSATAKNMGK